MSQSSFRGWELLPHDVCGKDHHDDHHHSIPNERSHVRRQYRLPRSPWEEIKESKPNKGGVATTSSRRSKRFEIVRKALELSDDCQRGQQAQQEQSIIIEEENNSANCESVNSFHLSALRSALPPSIEFKKKKNHHDHNHERIWQGDELGLFHTTFTSPKSNSSLEVGRGNGRKRSLILSADGNQGGSGGSLCVSLASTFVLSSPASSTTRNGKVDPLLDGHVYPKDKRENYYHNDSNEGDNDNDDHHEEGDIVVLERARKRQVVSSWWESSKNYTTGKRQCKMLLSSPGGGGGLRRASLNFDDLPSL